MTHIVRAPAVQVTVGRQGYFIERGGILPDGVPEDVVERLLDEGMIAAVRESAPPI